MEKEAMLYSKLKGKSVKCGLCRRGCTIPEGKSGFCGVRENKAGKLYALTYAKPCSMCVDPIEKKPLFHFWPGSEVFSIATPGCNFRCEHCQNWEISQRGPENFKLKDVLPIDVVAQAIASGAQGIAYTYTEPTIFFEYAHDIMQASKVKGLYNVFVSNGYFTRKALGLAKKAGLDAVNIDLKAFSDKFYREVCGGVVLGEVLDSIKYTHKKKVHLELAVLLIPGRNDSKGELSQMISWVKDNLGVNVPLHFTAFYPQYLMTSTPPTPSETVELARKLALDAGLNYVYCGNVRSPEAENTYCPKCGELLIQREGYAVQVKGIGKNKRCSACGAKIPIIGTFC